MVAVWNVVAFPLDILTYWWAIEEKMQLQNKNFNDLEVFNAWLFVHSTFLTAISRYAANEVRKQQHFFILALGQKPRKHASQNI